ncbi:hypothetical protein V8747_004216 [Escherichia coli]|uniref:DUF4094 domain-containing protein n=1 Tax=Escherichia coli TaxID=562 RepID=UPI0005109C69|nr:DUF4094 domain-containing protein [Escherichia coli]EFG4029620.1 hypothetical protein [Escherichia coli]EFG8528089.1 hypothetical protein [Escherichia coli]EFI5243738.1 hypothetical protein [Escherichia coli]EFJ1429104.1 hypothetical protein [Escherichia coli]EFN0938634.1 hypothetical protein [Escherichia coli]
MKIRQIVLLCLCSFMSQVCLGSVIADGNVVPDVKKQSSKEHKKTEDNLVSESKQQITKESVNSDVTISDEYQQELEAFKKLQMDNIRLKLQAENERLSQQSGIDSGEVKLVYIYSTSTRGRVAEVLGGGLGLREVQVGDHLYDGYTVQEIGKDYIRAVSNGGKENLLKLLFLGQE